MRPAGGGGTSLRCAGVSRAGCWLAALARALPLLRRAPTASAATSSGDREERREPSTTLLDRNLAARVECHDFFTASPTQPSSSRSQKIVGRRERLADLVALVRLDAAEDQRAAWPDARQQRGGGPDQQRAGQVRGHDVGWRQRARRQIDVSKATWRASGFSARFSRAD